MAKKIKKEVLDKFAKNIRNRYKGAIKKVTLFGSVARNEIDRESDIDILIIVKEREDKIIRGIEELAFKSAKDLGGLISVIILDRAAYEDMKKEKYPFLINVEREGVVLGQGQICFKAYG
jgi:predicted nucleotidyltransferase